MRRSRAVLAAVSCTLVLGAGVTACGGDSPEDKKAAAADFKKDAEAICTKAVAEIKRYGDGLKADSSKAEVGKVLAKIGDGFLAEIADLRKLDAPKDKAKAIKSWLDAFEAAAKETKDKGAALLDNGVESPFTEPDAQVKKLGYDACLSSAS